MSKVIGITADVLLDPMPRINQQHADFVPRPAVDAVVTTGALPVALPHLPSDQVSSLLNPLDGIILTGGPDVDPTFMDQEPLPALGVTNRDRDLFEIALVQQAVARHIPLLGICRGAHIINVALGGTLYQDLVTQYPAKQLKHQQAAPGDQPTHHVTVTASALQVAVGRHPFVNSRHHQAVNLPAAGLSVVARADDGVIEGLENADASVQAVQWHPENLWQHQPEELDLFQAFTDRL